MQVGTDEKLYPSLDLAYTIAMSSYDMTVKRFDAMDGKLNSLATFAVTVSFAIPVIAANRGMDFRSIWFYVAAIAFIAGVGAITYARIKGPLKMLDPTVLHDSYIDAQPEEFKRQILYYAGRHFDQNVRVVNRNGNLAAVAAMAFAIEVVAVAVWVAVAHS